MLVADPALVTGDMVEDVLKYKRLDGVEAALNKIAGATLRRRPPEPPAHRTGSVRSEVPVQVIWGARTGSCRSPTPRPAVLACRDHA